MSTAHTPSLAGQHVLVTGGSSGIGRACADRYRAEGATVFVADLHPTSSDEIQLDVGDPAAWAALAERLPALDVVHLNAGIATPGRALMAEGALPSPMSPTTRTAPSSARTSTACSSASVPCSRRWSSTAAGRSS